MLNTVTKAAEQQLSSLNLQSPAGVRAHVYILLINLVRNRKKRQTEGHANTNGKVSEVRNSLRCMESSALHLGFSRVQDDKEIDETYKDDEVKSLTTAPFDAQGPLTSSNMFLFLLCRSFGSICL